MKERVHIQIQKTETTILQLCIWMNELHLKSEDLSSLTAPRGREVPNDPRVGHHQDPADSQSQTLKRRIGIIRDNRG